MRLMLVAVMLLAGCTQLKDYLQQGQEGALKVGLEVLCLNKGVYTGVADTTHKGYTQEQIVTIDRARMQWCADPLSLGYTEEEIRAVDGNLP